VRFFLLLMLLFLLFFFLFFALPASFSNISETKRTFYDYCNTISCKFNKSLSI
jgi:hypothetical protein